MNVKCFLPEPGLALLESAGPEISRYEKFPVTENFPWQQREPYRTECASAIINEGRSGLNGVFPIQGIPVRERLDQALPDLLTQPADMDIDRPLVTLVVEASSWMRAHSASKFGSQRSK
ncbi:hypothetical protein [Paenibacillus thiaminolyticus]|uniref:hypothetical protein n=1 Tax=Paenibacillus thiaminolyticus TaxID=49283 RepID=UPI003B984AE2